jgi:hypothetical protein
VSHAHKGVDASGSMMMDLDDLLSLAVERGGRLVQHQNLRCPNDCPKNKNVYTRARAHTHAQDIQDTQHTHTVKFEDAT